MNGPSTNINDIVKDNKRLSNNDADMVDSIINDLNSQPTSQETMPQITDEEREVIMKQKAIHEQEKRQYQMQQQQKQIQNQQMKQQEEMINMYSNINRNENQSFEEKINSHKNQIYQLNDSLKIMDHKIDSLLYLYTEIKYVNKRTYNKS